MGLHLTSDDMARCEAASRAMLSPLSSATVDDWRREVSRTVRELFRADKTIFMLPKGEGLFFSDDAPSLATGVENYVTFYTTEGGIRLSDSIVDLWNVLRREERLDVFTWDVNDQMIGRYGHAIEDSDMVSGVLGSHGVRDFTGTYVDTAVGEVLLWLLFDQKGTHRFGESSAHLLRALLPSLKAGLAALVRLDSQRLALDACADAMVVFGPNRNEIHRNHSLSALYAGDPESARIAEAANQLAVALDLIGFPRSSQLGGVPFAPSIRSVTTQKARYDLKGTLLPPGAFGDESSIMVTVARHGGAELPQPEVLRERYRITSRESEVALLLAKGHTNDQIADLLFVSPHTVRRHTANIFDKIGVNTRKALALKFLGD